MKVSKEFLATVIVILVIFAGFEQYLVLGYEKITDSLLVTIDKLLFLLSGNIS